MEIPVPVQPTWLRRASAPLPGISTPGRLFDQRFGEGLLEAELAALCPAALAPYYLRAPSVALPTAQVPGTGEGQLDHFQSRGLGHPKGVLECPLTLSVVESAATEGLPEFPQYGISVTRLLKRDRGPHRSERVVVGGGGD